MAGKTSPQMSIETLASLGAKRSAEILHEHAHDGPRLLEKLESVLAKVPPVRAKLSGRHCQTNLNRACEGCRSEAFRPPADAILPGQWNGSA